MYIYSVCVYKTYPHSPSFFLYLLLSFFLSFILFLSFWGCLGVCSFHIYMFRFCCQKKKRRKKEKKGETGEKQGEEDDDDDDGNRNRNRKNIVV